MAENNCSKYEVRSTKDAIALVPRTSSLVFRGGGFTLIELMLTVSFVLLGTILIQGSFMRAADMFGRYSSTMKIAGLLNEESAKAREELLFLSGDTADRSGTIDVSKKKIEWNREVSSASGPGLYSVRLFAHWTESGRPFELKSEIYAYKKDLIAGQ